MALRPAINGAELTDWNFLVPANALRQGRRWYEVRSSDNGYLRDELTYMSPTTGMPFDLPAGRKAETVVPCRRPGTWHVQWTGGGEVQIFLIGVNVNAGGSSMSQSLHNDAYEAELDASGAFTFEHPGGATQCIVRITAINASDPLDNLVVCHEADLGNTSGASSEWRDAMQSIRLQVFRPMDWTKPVIPGTDYITDRYVTEWEHRRPDTWFTQSDVAFDVFICAANGHSFVDGQRVVIRAGGSGGAIRSHVTIVRTTSPAAGYSCHFKHDSSPNGSDPDRFGKAGDWIGPESGGAGVTLTADSYFWQPRQQGASHKFIRDMIAEIPTITTVVLNMPSGASDAYVAAAAAEWRDDPRMAGIEIAPEFGNEGWNPSFWQQRAHMTAQGVALGLPGASKGTNYQAAQWWAWRQNAVNEIWKGAYDLQMRGDEIIRVFAGWNALGEEWYRWFSILNPDSETNPSYPHTVYDLDLWLVAPYVFNNDQAPYNTSAWWATATDQDVLDYVRDFDIPLRITPEVQTGPPLLRPGGLSHHHVFATERGGECGCYEAGPHALAYVDGGNFNQAVYDRLLAIHRSPIIATIQDEIAAAIESVLGAGGLCCWYNQGSAWGTAGFWSYVEDPYNTGANAPNYDDDYRWLTLVSQSVEHSRTAAWGDILMQASAAAVVLIPGQPDTYQRGAASSLLTLLADQAKVALDPWMQTVNRGAAGSTLTLLAGSSTAAIDNHRRAGAGSELTLIAHPATAVRIGDGIEERGAAGSTLTVSAAVAAAELRFERASAPVTVLLDTEAATALVEEPVGPGAPVRKPGRFWNADDVYPWRKGRSEIDRGAFVGFGVEGNKIYPYKAGMRFGGVAAESADRREAAVDISESGYLTLDMSPSMAGKVVAVFVIDGQDFAYEEFNPDVVYRDIPKFAGTALVRGDGVGVLRYQSQYVRS